MICPELQLEAIRGLRVRRYHDAGIVDQSVQSRVLALKLLHKVPDGRKIGQIEPHELYARIRVPALDVLHRGVSFVQTPYGDDDLSILVRQHASGFIPDTAARAGHND